MDKATIGERIKNERTRLGLTQQEFGEVIGVTKQCLSRWEQGHTTPDAITLNLIAKKCSVPISIFLEDELVTTTKPENDTTANFEFTEKEKHIINKLRAMPADRRKAVEVLFGIREKK